MNYAEARELIKDGDLIAIRDRSKVFSRLTSLVTRSPYTHTAIALWGGAMFSLQAMTTEGRLLVVESNAGGASFSPLSIYEEVDFDVFDCPVDRSGIDRIVWSAIGKKIHYDIPDLARIAGNKLLGIPLPKGDDNNLVCSALSATIYKHAGWKPISLPSIPAPCDVVAALHMFPKLMVRND